MIRSNTHKAAGDIRREIMNRTNIASTMRPELLRWPVSLGIFILAMSWSHISLAQETKPKTFSSPAEASHALFLAVRHEDEQAVNAILGAGKEVTSSNDESEDKLEHERFSQKYEEMHRLVREPDGKTVLYIGAENWPFPIPLASKDGRWYFDSDAGTQEILFRQVGENETTAIEVCRAFVAKTKGVTSAPGDDQISQYAQNLTTAGAPSADDRTRAASENTSSAFHGYYFQLGAGQTREAAGGSNSYVSPVSKRAQAPVLVAVPAEYRGSGVMTFIVTQDGHVYQKDLGTDTAKLGPEVLKQHIAKSKWEPVE
jgi:hypothetical protein